MPRNRPILLDLFCCAGGAARGYQLAGFQTVGVDIDPQPRYAGDAFVRMNAVAALDVLLCGGVIVDTTGREWRLSDFAAIHASPPCQGYSIMRNLPWLRHKIYPLLIEPTREMLDAMGLPYVIENVAGARYRAVQPTGLKAGWLCGQMFGIPILRHRYFETNWPWLAPAHPKHWGTVRNGRGLGSRARDLVTLPLPPKGTPERTAVLRAKTPQPTVEWGIPRVVVLNPEYDPRGGLERHFPENGARGTGVNIGHAAGADLARRAMGIDWMTRDELTQAIPPVMTQYLGEVLMSQLEQERSR